MPCGWNKGTRKRVTAARILDLRIRKDKRIKGLSEAEVVCGFIESLTLTEETQTATERNTRGQGDNPLWFELRKGCITNSKCHDVYTKVNSVVNNRNQTEPRTTPLVSKL